MNVYHCMVALKDPSAAFGFSAASEAWLEYLCSEDLIKSWRLMRWRLPLASGEQADFIIEVEVDGEDSLERTFPREQCEQSPFYFERLQVLVRQMQIGPSRPYLEYEQRERLKLH